MDEYQIKINFEESVSKFMKEQQVNLGIFECPSISYSIITLNEDQEQWPLMIDCLLNINSPNMKRFLNELFSTALIRNSEEDAMEMLNKAVEKYNDTFTDTLAIKLDLS